VWRKKEKVRSTWFKKKEGKKKGEKRGCEQLNAWLFGRGGGEKKEGGKKPPERGGLFTTMLFSSPPDPTCGGKKKKEGRKRKGKVPNLQRVRRELWNKSFFDCRRMMEEKTRIGEKRERANLPLKPGREKEGENSG